MSGTFNQMLPRTTTSLAVCLVLLTACSFQPRYSRPGVPVPPAYKELVPTTEDEAWKAAHPADGSPRGKWWQALDDPRLNRLEEQVDISNQNIAAAAASFASARAIVRESRSQFFPAITGALTGTDSRLATFGPKPAGVSYTQYSSPFQASWEPDLWGRVRNTVGANTISAQVSAADLESTRLSAHAELAIDYFQLRSQDTLKELLDSTVAAYREALELTQDRYEAGLDSDEAVAQAETQLKSAEAIDTNIGVLRAQYEHAIALLVGEPASTFSIPAESL